LHAARPPPSKVHPSGLPHSSTISGIPGNRYTRVLGTPWTQAQCIRIPDVPGSRVSPG
jgi:hypothetical protein